ncbi:helix-turn-helix domain-containing protein [Priestia megaterium]|uniref:transposase n=1 Tax=Priestia megaterium TaxID=1404 RepID=UPI0027306D3E|nr:transposase [Priestia megaterium]MDP1383030.1 helix-turn-helix domain-containing protein [Priestia megaterium]MDP1426924.1 helix-turn-helix domain-containing protein [Priestia megaterium]
MAKGKYEKWITEEGLVLLEGWARAGLTDEQIAHNVGVSRSTLNDWKKKYPDISDALKKGKEVVDLQVENALLKRALGYEYEEITKESQWNEKTNKYELVITKSVKKRQAPDTTAQIFWLKNRRPDKWRDKQDVGHTGDMDLNIVIDYGEEND